MLCIEIVVRSPYSRSLDPDRDQLEDILKIIKRQVRAETGLEVVGRIIEEE